jgi:hypothetical protein
MKKNKILFCILCLILVVGTAFSQSKKKTPPKKKDTTKNKDIQVFDESKDGDIFDEKSSIQVKNTLKLNILSALAGDYPLYYERAISPHLSLEIGGGVSTMPLLAVKIAQPSGFFGINYGNQVVLDKNTVNPYGSFAIRYFASTGKFDIPEGYYFSLGTRWRKYSFNSHLDNESAPFPPQKSSTTHFDIIRLTTGFVSMKDNFLTEYYFGLGLRKTIKSSYFYDTANNFEITPYTTNSIAPSIIVGCRVGLGF